jgi:hypothetical protein
MTSSVQHEVFAADLAPRLWTARQVADYFQASISWVYHEAEAGRLPCLRFRGFLRFDPEAIKAFARAAASAPAALKSTRL